MSIIQQVDCIFCTSPGTILNIESQEMKFHEWGVGVDPDESCWVESVKFNVSFLVVIRVFYEIGSPACEEIGGCCQLTLSDDVSCLCIVKLCNSIMQ